MGTTGKSAQCDCSPFEQDAFERLLLEITVASTENNDRASALRIAGKKTQAFLGASAFCCWRLISDDELEVAATAGNVPEEFLGSRKLLSGDDLAHECLRFGRTVYRSAKARDSALFGGCTIKAVMASPLIVNAECVGVMMLGADEPSVFDQESSRKATIVAASLGLLLQNAKLHDACHDERRRSENLVAVALELNSSFRLPDFVQKFASRAADLMKAEAALLALARGGGLETVALYGRIAQSDNAVLRPAAHALAAAIEEGKGPFSGSAAQVFGQNLASSLGWSNVTLAPLRTSKNELLGVLCLADRGTELNAEDATLLRALASSAAVACENSRLFTRMDQANRHWMEIFDAISDFIVVHDESYRVLRVNRSFADFIGLRPSELVGLGMHALSMASEGEEKPCPFCRAGAGDGDEYIHPASERTYLISTSRIDGDKSDVLQTIHVLKDITDRREAERRYRELFDNIQEGLYFSSPDGRFVEVNDALVRMLGYDSREELLRVDIPHQLLVSREADGKDSDALQSMGVLRNQESVLRRKDGSLVYTLQNAFAVKDAHGRVTQYRGLMMDITELKTFQAELQRERDFSSKILNNTQSLILVVDTAGLISYANRRCYQPENFKDTSLMGSRLIDIVVPTRREKMSEALDSTLEGHQVDNLELPIQMANGRVAQCSVNLSPMRDEQGNVNSIVVVMTDITSAVMLQAKLMHTEKMAAVGQLVSGVAHEVNNPLTAVLGFADLLLDQPDVPDTAKKDLRIILQEAQRTKQIVQNLLSFARQTPPKHQLLQVNDVLRRTIALRSYDFTNHDVKVVEALDSSLPEVTGDAHQLQQVFLNILNNAYDAVCESGRPGVIEISSRCDENFADISFKDNGNGIRHAERIFDPFFTTKEVGKGTGLGLSICYGIVREHGGEIACRNNQDAPGATFIVRLPIKPALAKASGANA